MFDYYKTVTWAASLMSCWLLWQHVAVFVYHFCFLYLVHALHAW